MNKFLIDDAGWLESAQVIESPNFDARPEKAEIKLLVVHAISLPPEKFGGGYIQDFFCNKLDSSTDDYFPSICDLKVSAHCLIDRSGKIIQFVSFLDKAWHAGVSTWQGEANCNDFSIGIELEGSDNQAFCEVQYESLAIVFLALRRHYSSIEADAIVGHSDIAPGRKTDPGPCFDWPKLKRLIAK